MAEDISIEFPRVVVYLNQQRQRLSVNTFALLWLYGQGVCVVK
jgi:hypothetical protein